MATTLAPVDSRDVVRCDRCQLVQFRTNNNNCRRCKTSLDQEEPEPILAQPEPQPQPPAMHRHDIQVALAENDLASGRRNVASDVQKAVAQLATARQQARVAQQAEQTAKEGLRLARTRQEVGVGTQLEVRDAELKLTQAQLNVVGSLVDGREAEAALRRAQGG